MENYIRAVALEQALRPHPIRAISISPGVMDTAMQDSVRSADVGDFPRWSVLSVFTGGSTGFSGCGG